MPAKKTKGPRVRFEIRLRPALAKRIRRAAFNAGRSYNAEIDLHLSRAFGLTPVVEANCKGNGSA
jgi:hypothetical protein